MSTPGGYHDKCGGRSLGKQLNLYENPSVLNIPQCTHDIPITLIMVSPQCTEHPWCTAQTLCRMVLLLNISLLKCKRYLLSTGC